MIRKFFKRIFFTLAINRLNANANDIPYFLKKLAPQFRKDPEKYIDLIRSSTSGDWKFAPDEKDRYKWIRDLNIQTVIDVGAWQGSSAIDFHKIFPSANIYSFEPLRDCYERLEKLKDRIPGLYTFNFALGEKHERLIINKNEFSPSSSLLKMKPAHKTSFPFTENETSEEVEVRALDSVQDEIDFKNNVLMKIDVQGYEENVLNGARETLKKTKIIIIELSFKELYAGQPMFDKLYQRLTDIGYVYSGSWHQLLSPIDGTVLQQNGIFIRK